jgi:hypothetical protein
MKKNRIRIFFCFYIDEYRFSLIFLGMEEIDNKCLVNVVFFYIFSKRRIIYSIWNKKKKEKAYRTIIY